MTNPDWQTALRETDSYYTARGGRSYSDEQVDRWLDRWFTPLVKLTGKEQVLDLCCGDGCWAFGLLRRFPELEIKGADVSSSAVKLANERAAGLGVDDHAVFITHDCEQELPLPESSLDLIFARGVFVFNQHDMMRPGCLHLLEHWHRRLRPGGRFVAMYGSKPERLGSYTPPEETAGLPTNLCPRRTDAVDFCGGKYNHSPDSFQRPFRELTLARTAFYRFEQGRHTLITRRCRLDELNDSGCDDDNRSPPPTGIAQQENTL